MAIVAGTYDFTVQRRADHTESIRLTDSNDQAINLLGYTIAAQVWDKARTGKYADFVVHSSNLLTTSHEELLGSRVLRTVVAGKDHIFE